MLAPRAVPRRVPALLLASALAACGGTVSSSAASVPDAGGGDSSRTLVDGATAEAATPEAAAPDVAVPSQPAPQQKYVFEAGFVNQAWGFTYSGVYVTSDGAVYSYSYSGPDTSATIPVDPRPGMTEAEVSAKYASNPTFLTTVDTTSLQHAFALVDAAQSGMLLGTFSCADYGERTYVAWLFDLVDGDLLAGASRHRRGQRAPQHGARGRLHHRFHRPGGGHLARMRAQPRGRVLGCVVHPRVVLARRAAFVQRAVRVALRMRRRARLRGVRRPLLRDRFDLRRSLLRRVGLSAVGNRVRLRRRPPLLRRRGMVQGIGVGRVPLREAVTHGAFSL
jgi:hypothetical protein